MWAKPKDAKKAAAALGLSRPRQHNQDHGSTVIDPCMFAWNMQW